jgi:hypothetical protein
MAEHGAIASGQDCGPDACHVWHRTAECGEHAPKEALPNPTIDTRLQYIVGDALSVRLFSGDDAVLAAC